MIVKSNCFICPVSSEVKRMCDEKQQFFRLVEKRTRFVCPTACDFICSSFTNLAEALGLNSEIQFKFKFRQI